MSTAEHLPNCIACSGGVSLLQAASTIMTANATIMQENARLTAALAECHTRLGHQSNTGDGTGAASPEVYEAIVKRNWHGRLGRTNMVDVDQMSPAQREKLDQYLRQTLNAMFPVNGAHGSLEAEPVFQALRGFGLRLEDRSGLVDVPIFNDGLNNHRSPESRIQNLSAWFYSTSTAKFGEYWQGSALETVMKLAHYRGLFDSKGLVKQV